MMISKSDSFKNNKVKNKNEWRVQGREGENYCILWVGFYKEILNGIKRENVDIYLYYLTFSNNKQVKYYLINRIEKEDIIFIDDFMF